MIFLAKGMIAGLIITAPVGPVGVLCVNRTLTRGMKAGFISGLGAVTADGFYGAVAAYGLTAISSVINVHQFWFRTLGGLFLIFLGIRLFRARPLNPCDRGSGGTLISEYLSTLVLTLTNPIIIVAFAGIFAALGLGNIYRDFFSATMIVSGVITGSVIGWLTLSVITYNVGGRTGRNILPVVNKVSGIVIIIFALVTLVSVLRG